MNNLSCPDRNAATRRRARGSALPPFRPSWWFGPHLQTGLAQTHAYPSSPPTSVRERLEVPTSDESGDRLIATLEVPQRKHDGPLVVLLHGLTGSCDSPYVRTCAEFLREAGLATLAVNARGCGDSAATCRRIHHPARTRDLRDVLDAVTESRHASLCRDGLVLVGMSLGGDTILRLLGEGTDHDVRAAVAVSPTIALAETTALVESQWIPYARLMLRWMKDEFLRPTSVLTDRERAAVRAAGSITELHERFTAPHFGLLDAAAFYDSCSPLPVLPRVAVPTLVLHAEDDPIVPRTAYDDVDWNRCPELIPGLVERGGHVGFAQSAGPPWHHACILDVARAAGSTAPHSPVPLGVVS